jgi:hypothetical protein
VTGLQVAFVGTIASLERWRGDMPPRQYVVLLDLLLRWLENELGRLEPSRQRWAT